MPRTKVTQLATKLEMWDTLVDNKLNIVKPRTERPLSRSGRQSRRSQNHMRLHNRVSYFIKEMKGTKLSFDQQASQILGNLLDDIANWKMIEMEKNETHKEIILKEIKGDINNFWDS